MESMNIHRAFLLPGFVGLGALDHPDPLAGRILAQAHNRLVFDIADQADEIEFVPVVIPDNPEWSIRELKRWQTQRPVRAVVSRPTTRHARPYGGEIARPLLDYLIETQTVLMLHGATGYHQASPMADSFTDYRYTHVFSHPFEQMIALADLVGSRVLDAGLRVAIVEAGCGWLPWFAGRLQEHFDHTGGLPRIDLDVTELLRRQIILSVEPGDPGIEHVIAELGDGLLTFGSDFPHWDAARPEDLKSMADRLTADNTQQLLYQNAFDFFYGR
jgi:hypothetical protein